MQVAFEAVETFSTAVKRYLNVRQTAQYVGVSEAYLNRLRSIGGGPVFLKLGARIIYSIDELDAWLASRRRTSTSDRGEAA